jgi:uncharacterized protein (DUF697 family)
MVADQEKPAADPKAAEASKIIRNHAIAAVATCLIPIPFVGVGLLAGAHLRMISQLARLYEVSLLRLSPALGLLGALTLPSASTYALGKVFTEHFESGGTFLTFDPEKARALYDKALTEKAAEEESYEGVKP